ncbi:4'-phosphopantetheinyl transferase family protein [Lysobacter niabensis]|uniref:4'-phosphopantetheinyl transferase family protein n=1 Tax=Agrilutibacter niabensis TaxID=380628 RepID=UPI00361143F0
MTDSQSQCTTLRQAFEGALSPSPWRFGPDTGVVVGLFDLHDWQPWLANAYAMLDARERDRVQGRRAATDRDQLALAYALHRLLLGNALACDAANVPIGRDAAGCPRLSGERLYTSLSHADRVLALVVSATGPVGVDIEPSSRASVMPEIAGRVCHPADTAEIAGLVEPAWAEALLALWVRKEAFLKAAGIGLQREMDTFTAPDNALLALPGGGMTRVRMLQAGPRWVAAAAGAPDIPVESAWLRPAAPS